MQIREWMTTGGQLKPSPTETTKWTCFHWNNDITAEKQRKGRKDESDQDLFKLSLSFSLFHHLWNLRDCLALPLPFIFNNLHLSDTPPGFQPCEKASHIWRTYLWIFSEPKNRKNDCNNGNNWTIKTKKNTILFLSTKRVNRQWVLTK